MRSAVRQLANTREDKILQQLKHDLTCNDLQDITGLVQGSTRAFHRSLGIEKANI
jgi:hypothetical protein